MVLVGGAGRGPALLLDLINWVDEILLVLLIIVLVVLLGAQATRQVWVARDRQLEALKRTQST